MPEGDTIHGAADRLDAALRNQSVVGLSGTHRAAIEYGKRVVGATVTEVTAHGKHLLVNFSNDWTLRTHLQMTGSWHIYAPDEKWRKTAGKARVVVETDTVTAVCFAAPTVQLAPRHVVARRLDQLGPDLMLEQDFAAVAAEVSAAAPHSAICDAIVDQALVAGLGNVYRSELLFESGLHPDIAVSDVGVDDFADLLRRGHQMLNVNRGRLRSTTGSRRPGQQTWVYGRSGKPCRRCGTSVEYGTRGPLARDTYWCPSCQPPPQT